MSDSTTTTSARAWRTVLEKIESDLLEGRLAPGDRLAPERELASTLGVGRSSVREALRVLEVMGLIRTGTGSGPTAGAIIIARPVGGMAALLRLQVAAQGFPIDDVVSTRLVLEEAVVEALAADPDRALGDVHVALATMDAPGLTPADFLALDAQLHLALAEASGNLVITAMMTGLRSAIEAYVQQGAVRFADWDAEAARLRAEHRGILAAIESGDGPGARSLLHDHISNYYGRTETSRPSA